MAEKFTVLDFNGVTSVYEDGEHRAVCASCGSYYEVSPSELKEARELMIAMYEALKEQYFVPDCGGDFCFLATEGMENECPEPEGGTSNCKFKEHCRAMNVWMIKRNKVLTKVKGKGKREMKRGGKR